MARVALIDPELGVEVPREVTARSGMDALCQCIEAYVSSGASPLTDAIALQGIELAGRYLKRAYDDGQDLEAREGMALAALIGGVALSNAGLGAVHGFAAPLGANFPIPHGTICGVLLPHVIRANRSHGVLKYADVDQALGRYDAAEACGRLVQALKVRSLGSFGLDKADVAAMVPLAKRASSMRYNPVVLDDVELTDILKAAI
jgi:alcohol dehydrogenase class IV